MMAETARAVTIAVLLASNGAGSAASIDDARGYWLGTEQRSVYKRALMLTYTEKHTPEGAHGDGRFGSTGFGDYRTLPPVVKWRAYRAQAGIMVEAGDALKLRLTTRDRMEGVVTRRQGDAPIVFERVASEDDLKRVAFNAAAIPEAKRITLAFLSTPDCPACRWWQTNHGERFASSEMAKAIRYVQVKGPNLPSGVRPADWPADVRALGAQLGDARQPVPSFVVALGDEVLVQQFGALFWELRVEPLLRHLLDTQRERRPLSGTQ